jgi:hypothetical protein
VAVGQAEHERVDVEGVYGAVAVDVGQSPVAIGKGNGAADLSEVSVRPSAIGGGKFRVCWRRTCVRRTDHCSLRRFGQYSGSELIPPAAGGPVLPCAANALARRLSRITTDTADSRRG